MPTTVTPCLGPHAGLLELSTVRLDRGTGLRNREAILELDEVDHLARDQVRNALAHFPLGEDDMVGSDSLRDAAVLLAVRLGPDVADLHLAQIEDREHACLEVLTDCDHGVLEIGHTQLFERLEIRRVRLYHVTEDSGMRLDVLLLCIDGQDIMAQLGQGTSDPRAETTQTDHDDAVGTLSIQQLASPPGTDRTVARGSWQSPQRG